MEKLQPEERETIICFNAKDKMASVFTYDKVWQRHLEERLKLKPVDVNGFGGREYQIDKKRIKPPRVPKKLSAEAKKKLVQTLPRGRIQRPV